MCGASFPKVALAGRVCPARHAGSVDIFLEAFETAAAGDVLVVDNAGRIDEACVGDLVALEAQAAGLSGIVIWGLHRDTADIRAIGLPVFSLGAIPTGPLRLDPRPPQALESADVGELDGDSGRTWPSATTTACCSCSLPSAGEVLAAAEAIRDTERRQAERIRAGASLRTQTQFTAYLAERVKRPDLSFRDHLRAVGGAIEV